MNAAVFLDRDGTIIEHVPYLRDPSRVRIVPGGLDALKRLSDAGFLLVLFSNQSLVARGLGTHAEAQAVHTELKRQLTEGGVRLDSAKYCFDAPDAPGFRRKPSPGMILEAAAEFDIFLPVSAVVGDDPRDIAAGQAAGCGLNIFITSSPENMNEVSTLGEAAERVLHWKHESSSSR